MASTHYYAIINRKINTLKRKSEHFEACREDALQKIKRLFVRQGSHLAEL